MTLSIAIAADHAGVRLKEKIVAALTKCGHNVTDCGTHGEESVDYPDFAAHVTQAIIQGSAERGILICGTGIGMSIAANRHSAIRAALCHTPETAALTRQHNDANILVLGARVTDEATALACVERFLTTAFEGGRHQKRLDKIT